MIIPLYNLQAHNDMTNAVLGVEARVRIAKFLKPGLEVTGLAVLHPTEGWVVVLCCSPRHPSQGALGTA